ncbi:hypothetical protein [Methanogenium cariaci]|uniref:hypothetical protein n=1 Tax=Methanogenium cariaci TaxID=2197 RepID=UPI0007853AE8|nr:hypothetical protein [Methanogenium cariaci]
MNAISPVSCGFDLLWYAPGDVGGVNCPLGQPVDPVVMHQNGHVHIPFGGKQEMGDTLRIGVPPVPPTQQITFRSGFAIQMPVAKETALPCRE